MPTSLLVTGLGAVFSVCAAVILDCLAAYRTGGLNDRMAVFMVVPVSVPPCCFTLIGTEASGTRARRFCYRLTAVLAITAAVF